MEAVLDRTEYGNVEVVLVDTGEGGGPLPGDVPGEYTRTKVRLVERSDSGGVAERLNAAVAGAQGELVCLLDEDVVPLHGRWLGEMVAHALRPEIGAVGAAVFDARDGLRHGGLLLDGRAAAHLHRDYPRGATGYGNRARLAQNLSAVTSACLVVRRETWIGAGGMDSAFRGPLRDVDLCLRLGRQGFLILWLPQAELRSLNCKDRGDLSADAIYRVTEDELALFRQRWGGLCGDDPAWNPNLRLDGVRITLAVPPRGVKPWLSAAA
jgi:GT2 family glycosyltransferase